MSHEAREPPCEDGGIPSDGVEQDLREASKDEYESMLVLTEDTPVSAFLGGEHDDPPDSVAEELHNQLLDDLSADRLQPQDLTTSSRTVDQSTDMVGHVAHHIPQPINMYALLS